MELGTGFFGLHMRHFEHQVEERGLDPKQWSLADLVQDGAVVTVVGDMVTPAWYRRAEYLVQRLGRELFLEVAHLPACEAFEALYRRNLRLQLEE